LSSTAVAALGHQGLLLAFLTRICPSCGSDVDECLEANAASWQAPQKDLYIGPELKRISGWSDEQSILSGIFEVDFDWNLTFFADFNAKKTDLRNVVSVEELITGNSGRIQGIELDWKDCVTFYEHRRTLMTYVGDFAQVIDGTCYPFDEVMVKFTLQLKSDWTHDWKTNLFCKAHSDCVAYDSDGNILDVTDPWRLGGGLPYNFVVSKIVVSQPFSAKGFAWSSMTCQTSSRPGRIVCSLTGIRNWKMPFCKWVLPGVVMIVIGFSSFVIPSDYRMPRVATTMIAMLTFVNGSTAAFNALPATGTSWILEFYLLGTFALCVNMIGHVASFRYERLAPIIEDIALAIGFFGLTFCLALRLHFRVCVQVPRGLTLAGTIIAAFCFLVALSMSAYKYKASLKVRTIRRSRAQTSSETSDARNRDPRFLPFRRWALLSKGSSAARKSLQISEGGNGDGVVPEASQAEDVKTLSITL